MISWNWRSAARSRGRRARPEAVEREVLDRERRQDASRRSSRAASSRRRTRSRREAAHEAAGEGVAGAGRIDDVLERIRPGPRRTRPSSNSSAPDSPRLMTTRCGPMARIARAALTRLCSPGELARLLVVDDEQVDRASTFAQRGALAVDPEVHRVQRHEARASCTCSSTSSCSAGGCCRGRRTRRRGSASGSLGWKSAKTLSCVSSVVRLVRS